MTDTQSTPTLHPLRKVQAVRQGIQKMTPMIIHHRASGLPWEVHSIEVWPCEDDEHVMFYGDTGTDHWIYALIPYDLKGEEWIEEEWIAALNFVSYEDDPVSL